MSADRSFREATFFVSFSGGVAWSVLGRYEGTAGGCFTPTPAKGTSSEGDRVGVSDASVTEVFELAARCSPSVAPRGATFP